MPCLVSLQVDVIHSGLRMQLLDVGTGEECLPWGKELPPRLRRMHSHWICRHVLQFAEKKGLLCAKEKLQQLRESTPTSASVC